MTPEAQEIERLKAALAAIGEQLEFDRTAVAVASVAAKKAIASRSWLAEDCRGSFEWDDDRYRLEFGAAIREIATALDPLAKISADWSGCPKSAAGVSQARIDWKARAESAEAEVAALKREIERLKTRAELSDALEDSALQEAITCGREAERLKWSKEVAALREKLEAAQKDTERLDWLQTSDTSPNDTAKIVNGFIFRRQYWGSLRGAIDAARSEASTKEGTR